MKEIKRDRYLKKLINRKENGSIKVITGIRRCGKSYLLFHLYKNYLISQNIDKNSIIEIQLDNDDFEDLRDRKKLSAYIKEKTMEEKQFYIFLDEVQFCEGFEGVLNGLIHHENLDVYVTGSNSKFLSSDILTEFRGRGDEVRVYPLSFGEFSSAYDGDAVSAWKEYTIYGGLPQIISKKTDEQKISFLKDLFASTYVRDVVERNNLKNDVMLENIIDVLASDIGSYTNATKLSNTFNSRGIKTNDKTVSSYISHLLNAFIIEKAEKFDIKGKKYIASPQKYYFCDVGLRNARLNFRQQELTHIMENIIYNELLIRGFNVDVGMVEKYSKDKTGNQTVTQMEIDFVCNLGSKRYYIQSSWSLPDAKKIQQETASLDRLDDSFKKIIVTSDNVKPWYTEKGYYVVNVIDFLLGNDFE